MSSGAIRVLFVKPELAWPRTSGHDVYCYYMMKGLAALGAEVSLATVTEIDPRAIEGIALAHRARLSDATPAGTAMRLTWLQERYRSFWGVSHGEIESVRTLARDWQADVVVAFGLPALPFLAGVDSAVRVWAMADEWVYHHLSQVSLTDRSSWHHFRSAAIKGVYERAYRSMVDRAWAVSDTDKRAGRWLAGIRELDLLPNGVDTDFYRPIPAVEIPRSAIFWGRLDFEPNIDALTWFCREVWPGIKQRTPDARFTIVGYNPTLQIKELAQGSGITLLANVDDLRLSVCEHALVVLPMVSGGGIKNKLLEGAAMGRPIVCTPRACMDLRPSGSLPLEQVTRPSDWVVRVTDLWNDESRRAALGTAARSWVSEYYSWMTPARNALDAFERASRR